MREQVKSLKQERDSFSEQLEVKESSIPDAKLPTEQTSPGDWLTVGEAYQVATARGLDKSDVTFRRWLKNAIAVGSMPEELRCIGLLADFNSRRLANPSNNSLRWLRFEDGNGYPTSEVP